MKKITKKHLLYALIVFSVVGNICFYMGKQKAKQEVINVTEELTKSEEKLAVALVELTEKEEEVAALETELSEEKSNEKAMFAEVAAADYLETSRLMTSIHSATLDRLVTTYHLYDDTDDAYPKLIDTAMISTADGEEKELFIISHVDKSNEEIAPFWALADSLILVDYKNGTDELLFQTENKEIERLDSIITYYEYFDMEIQDIDGNGEEDFVLLIGGHYIYSGSPEKVKMFCLIGLQEKGEFHVVSSGKEDWLYEVIKSLKEIDEENRKIDVFMDDVKQHFGNGKIEPEQKEDKDDNAGNQLETYIASKDEQMSEWTFYNSRYFDQELLWESYVYDDSNHVKKLKIYKEHGDRGNTMHQIALYLYDYTTGEVEKQSVAGIFAEVMEERLLEFKDVELRDVLYEDLNGDGIPDIKMTPACIIEDSAGRETEELYEIIHWYQADSGEFVCEKTISIQPVSTSYRIQDKYITQEIKDTEIQLNICCPQIIYPDAQDIAAKINQSIEERIIQECVVEHSAYDFDYEVKYRGEECFSILFWGMRSGSGAHPNDIAVGLTYDMTTGRLLHITDIIEKTELQQKLEQRNFEQQHGIKVYYYEKDVARGEVNWFDQYWLNQYVSEKSACEEGEHKTDFYLTPDKIGILYEVGHSFGDYIILEIERTDERE